ncbi:unnamed protein product, partial [marine sediment metagenome]
MLRDREKIFTGAFMIASPAGKPKLEAICQLIDLDLMEIDRWLSDLEECTTLEAGWALCRKPHHMGLMAYELITDLRHTYLLRDATDVMTWAYFGPGAQRGVCRMLGREVTSFASGRAKGVSCSQTDCLTVARELLAIVEKELGGHEAFKS